VPFFVFVVTLVVIVVVIVLLVLRLGAMLPAPGGQGVAATPTTGVAVGPAPSATALAGTGGPHAGQGTGALRPVVFGTGYNANGGPLYPARRFPATVPHVYAFTTLDTVPAGAAIHFLWHYGPKHTLLADVPEHSLGPAYARHTFSSYYTPDTPPFATGPYTVSVTMANRTVAKGGFQIVAP
jgi:hypothetical protein